MSQKLLITQPCSPSDILDHKEIRVKEFIISYSGKTIIYYVTEYTKDKDGFYSLITYEDIEVSINQMFVVSITPKRFIKLITDTLGHANYRLEKYTKHITTEFILINDRDQYEIVNSYTPGRKPLPIIVQKEIEYI